VYVNDQKQPKHLEHLIKKTSSDSEMKTSLSVKHLNKIRKLGRVLYAKS